MGCTATVETPPATVAIAPDTPTSVPSETESTVSSTTAIVPESDGRPVTAEIDGVATLTVPQPDVTASMTVVYPEDVDLPAASLAPSSGANVTIHGTLTTPAELRLTLADAPDPDAVPGAWHIADDGTVTLVPGRWDTDTNQLAIVTTDFSGWIPDWLDPVSWVAGVIDFTADYISGRTDPPQCADAHPDWAAFTPPFGTGTVHTCFQSNTDQTTGVERAEVLFKSNRRGLQAVTIPATAMAYTWVEGQSEWLRPHLSKLTGANANSNILLPGGMSASFGFNQPGITTETNIAVYTTPATIIGDLVMAMVGIAAGADTSDLLTVAAAVNSCSLALFGTDITHLDTSIDFSLDTTGAAIVSCALATLPGFADADKAQQAIIELDNTNMIAGTVASGGDRVGMLIDTAQAIGEAAKRIANAVNIAGHSVDAYDHLMDNAIGNSDAHILLTGTEPPPIAIDEAFVADDVGCHGDCSVTGLIPFSHPTWGPSTVATYLEGCGELGNAGIIAYDATGTERWRWKLGDTCEYELQPSSRSIYPSAMAPRYESAIVSEDQDTRGHLFIDYNPGRYNGVIVLVPTNDGFDDLDSLPRGDSWSGGFYYADVIDVDADGAFEILDLNNDCAQSCAGGTISNELLVWNGTDYDRTMDVDAFPHHYETMYGQYSTADSGPLWSGCTPGSDTLPDGTWMGYVTGWDADGLDFDLACDFAWPLSLDGPAPPVVVNDNTLSRRLQWSEDAYAYAFDETMWFLIGPEPISVLLNEQLYVDYVGDRSDLPAPAVIYLNNGTVSGIAAIHRD